MSSRPFELQRGHIPALDGIRGIAILLVLLCHLFFAERTGVPWVDVLYRAASAGWMGVDLFFVLSGFLITGILIEARQEHSELKNSHGYFRNFYARRTLRIFPLYYGVLLLALALTLTLGRHSPPDPEDFRHAQGWLWTFTANLPMAAANHFYLFKAWHLTFSPLWSLAVEEQFYLVWPLIVWLCPPRHLLKIAAGVGVASAVARVAYVQLTGREITAYLFSPFRLDALLIGAICALVVRSQRLCDSVQPHLRGFIMAWSIALVIVFYFTDWLQANRFVSGIGFSILDVGFAAVILECVIHGGVIRRAAEHRSLRLLGKYSFGLYVLHLMVLAPILNPTYGRYGMFIHHSVWTQLAAKPFAAAAAIAVAAASWHLYEKHFLRFKRYFEYPSLRRAKIDAQVGASVEAGIA